MRSYERVKGLVRSPLLFTQILLMGRYDYDYDRMPLSARHMSLGKRLNLLKAGGNFIHRRLRPWSLPLHMQIELTDYCNLRCPVCPAGTRALSRKPRAIDVELFEKLMEQVGPTLLTLSLWGWGEPALHPRLGEILKIVSRYPVHTLLSTNGQTLNRDSVIQALVEYPPTHLIVAVDGLTDQTHSVYRVGAKLAPILAGVRRLADLKEQKGLQFPILHMRYIVMQHNEHELPHLAEFAREHRFDFLSYRSLVIIDAPEKSHRDLVPNLADWRAYGYKGEERVNPGGFICQQPFWFPTVLVDGTVVGCEQDWDAQQPLGVFSPSTTFASIWYGERASQVRKIIRDTPETLSFCRNCPYAGLSTSACSVRGIRLNPAIRLPTVLPVA